MSSLRTGAVGLAAGLLATASLAGTAVASTSVTTAIRAQDTALKHDSTLSGLRHIHVTKVSQLKVLIPKYRVLATRIDRAATVVSHASASSSRQRDGRRDWVAGTRREATGVREIAGAFGKLAHGEKASGATALKTALKTVAAGDAETIRGDRLLGLPTHD